MRACTCRVPVLQQAKGHVRSLLGSCTRAAACCMRRLKQHPQKLEPRQSRARQQGARSSPPPGWRPSAPRWARPRRRAGSGAPARRRARCACGAQPRWSRPAPAVCEVVAQGGGAVLGGCRVVLQGGWRRPGSTHPAMRAHGCGARRHTSKHARRCASMHMHARIHARRGKNAPGSRPLPAPASSCLPHLGPPCID